MGVHTASTRFTIFTYRRTVLAMDMDMVTDYFVATPERAMALAEWGPAGEDVPKLENKVIEHSVFGSILWAIIEDSPATAESGSPFDLDRFDASGPLMALSEEQTSGLDQIADGFVRALATLPDERITAVAARWAAAEEWGRPYEPGELDDTVRGLRDLAREAHLPDQHMYLWWSIKGCI